MHWLFQQLRWSEIGLISVNECVSSCIIAEAVVEAGHPLDLTVQRVLRCLLQHRSSQVRGQFYLSFASPHAAALYPALFESLLAQYLEEAPALKDACLRVIAQLVPLVRVSVELSGELSEVLSEQLSGKSSKETSEWLSEQSSEQSSEQPSKQPPEQLSKQPPEQPSKQPPEQPSKQPPERLSEPPASLRQPHTHRPAFLHSIIHSLSLMSTREQLHVLELLRALPLPLSTPYHHAVIALFPFLFSREQCVVASYLALLQRWCSDFSADALDELLHNVRCEPQVKELVMRVCQLCDSREMELKRESKACLGAYLYESMNWSIDSVVL